VREYGCSGRIPVAENRQRAKRETVPLSEDEQRILSEIERSFYEHDPAFARKASSATLTRRASRNCKLAAAAFVLGLLILLTSFARTFWLGAFGFLIMLGSAFLFVTNVRKLSTPGLQNMAQSVRGRGFGDLFGDQRRRLRERFKREE
jgi:hypothetical protein